MCSEDEIISEIEKMTGKEPLFYLKFCGEKQYADDVLEGRLFANTPKYYRELEISTGMRGQGDKNELTLVNDVFDIKFTSLETKELSFTLPKAVIHLSYKEDDNVPMVCFSGFSLSEMKAVKFDEKHIELALPFSDAEYDEMSSTFGSFCVIIGAHELRERIRQTYPEIKYILGPVEYVSSASLSKAQAFANRAMERFLLKDEDLSYQREHRLVISIECPKDHYINVGRLHNAMAIRTDELRQLQLSIGYRLEKQNP